MPLADQNRLVDIQLNVFTMSYKKVINYFTLRHITKKHLNVFYQLWFTGLLLLWNTIELYNYSSRIWKSGQMYSIKYQNIS